MRRVACCLLLLAFGGCFTTTPRFEQPVATTFASEPMRVMRTAELELYYPASHRHAAERVASRAAQCVTALRARQHDPNASRARALLFITSANYNNAYVGGQLGGEPLHALNPLVVSREVFHWYGLPSAETGDIACHEMFHYAHLEQVSGFWGLVNTIVGPITPSQLFLERWFTEGVAQYYEGRLGRTVGRPFSPIYRGAFESFVADKGKLEPGDLSLFQRQLSPYSGAYLASLHFVEWLVERSGEDALWQLMQRQGASLFAPFGATLRFKQVYGADVGDLVAEFSQALAARPKRVRPNDQRTVRKSVGQLARLASHAESGTLALITEGNDEAPWLRILGADGKLRLERPLLRLDPGRPWILAGPDGMSGLSFSADGRRLYLVNDELRDRGDTSAQLWTIDVETGEVLDIKSELGPMMGGALHPSGERYTVIHLTSEGARLEDIELKTGARTTLHSFAPGGGVGGLSWAPDGKRLVFSRLEPQGWNLWIRDEAGAVRPLTRDGAFNYGARFSGANSVMFVRTFEGHAQVHRLEVETGRLERLSDAPFAVLDPAPLNGGVAFVNREGWGWSVDAVPLKPVVVAEQRQGPVAMPGGDASPAAAGDDGNSMSSLRPPHSHHGNAPSNGGPLTSLARSGVHAGDLEAVTDGGLPTDEDPWPVPPPLTVESDEAYSPFPSLLVPQLRAPSVWLRTGVDELGASRLETVLGLTLMGRDRLGHYTWALTGLVALPGWASVISAELRTSRLAPWELALAGSREALGPLVNWNAALTASRTFGVVPVSLGWRALISQQLGRPLIPHGTDRFIGPTASISWSAGEVTPYTGPRKLLSFSASATGYPRALGSTLDLADLSASLGVAVPLPLSTRHSLQLTVGGRALPGAPTGALLVGGDGATGMLINDSQPDEPPGPSALLPGRFVQHVRGYEDFGVRAGAAGVGLARYRASIIVDRGFASLLYLLPSLFLRQVDLEAFFSAAVTDQPQARWLRALGGAVLVRLVVAGMVPVTLGYQVSVRFDAPVPPLHIWAFGFE